MSKYELEFTSRFFRELNKIKKKNYRLARKVRITLEKIVEDPFQNSLKTHRVDSKDFGVSWSSRVTGDLRVIWDFRESDDELVVLALAIGGHEGGKKVYK